MSDILTPAHRAVLSAVGKSDLRSRVYFTGGTLLAAHYLHHRRSFDLDFFSDDLLDDLLVADAIRFISKTARARKVRLVTYPNRRQYFLQFDKKNEIKLEIVYFPFPAVNRRMVLPKFKVTADSLRDIAVNKTHASFERDAPRDAFDLYIIMKKRGWKLADLLRDVERKFGTVIDPVHLGARIVGALERLDEVKPLFIGRPPTAAAMISFFKSEANSYLRTHLQ